MGFTKLQLHEDLLRGIIDTGFSTCMPVQEETLAHTLTGKDVYVQSQTGSGKTAAFLVTIFQLFLHDNALRNKKSLIIAPTRELAVQIENEAKLLGRYLDIKTGCFYGGVSYTQQEKAIKRGVDIIIGTPGRLLDFNQQGKLDFSTVGVLVIDEADRMFDMGFLPDIRRMLRKMPPVHERLTMLFSATLDYRVRELAWEHMNEPVEIELNPESRTVTDVTQELYHTASEEKMSLLLGILKKENPSNALIFTNTKHAAVRVAQRLERNGYPCKYIMGDLPQKKRLNIIEGIKSGDIQFLVATDVAARGLHIDDLELVVNYDLPYDGESYVHRIGRTARVGKKGKAISLACDKFVYSLEAVEDYIKQAIPVIWADEETFLEDRSAGMKFEQPTDMKKRGRSSGKNRASSERGKADRTSRRQASGDNGRPAQAQKKKRNGKGKNGTANKGPTTDMSREERLAYYAQKYGESFTPAEKTPSPVPTPEKKSLFSRILNFFS